MYISKEREIIYQLMHEIIEERRELSKQYYDLKSKLDQIGQKKLMYPNKPIPLYRFLIVKR